MEDQAKKKDEGKEEAVLSLRAKAKRRERERRRLSLYCDLNGACEREGKGKSNFIPLHSPPRKEPPSIN